MSIQRHITNHRLSEAVKANGFIFLAGQVPTNPEGDAEAQTANVLAQIDTLYIYVRSMVRMSCQHQFSGSCLL